MMIIRSRCQTGTRGMSYWLPTAMSLVVEATIRAAGLLSSASRPASRSLTSAGLTSRICSRVSSWRDGGLANHHTWPSGLTVYPKKQCFPQTIR